jgi:hypothetical protein
VVDEQKIGVRSCGILALSSFNWHARGCGMIPLVVSERNILEMCIFIRFLFLI